MRSVNEDILRQTLLVIAARSVRDLRIGDFYEVLYSGVPNIEALSGVRHALHSLCLEGFLRSPMSGQYLITRKGRGYLAANRIRIASQGVKRRLRELNESRRIKQENEEPRADATEQQEKDNHNQQSARHRKYVRKVNDWAVSVSDGAINAEHPILRRAIDTVLQGGITGVQSQEILGEALKKAIVFSRVERGKSASTENEKGDFPSKSDGKKSRIHAVVQERSITGNGAVDKESPRKEITASQVPDELYRGFDLVPYMKKAEKGELTVQDTFEILDAYINYDDWFYRVYLSIDDKSIRQNSGTDQSAGNQKYVSAIQNHRIHMEAWSREISHILKTNRDVEEDRESEEMDQDEQAVSGAESGHEVLVGFTVGEWLNILHNMSPREFEYLTLHLFMNMGYGKGEVVGRSGDGGIDVIIKRDPLGLEQVHIQAKRWQNDVGEPDIRNFWTSLQAKGASKGVYVTTAGFRKPARDAANVISSVGNQTLVLIDGMELARLLIEYGVDVDGS